MKFKIDGGGSTDRRKDDVIRTWLVKQGFHPPTDGYDAFCDEMFDWYKGYVESFHKYSVNTGAKQVGVTRYSLGMAKTIAEDYANLLLNEKVKITADGAFSKQFDAILQNNDFFVRANNLLELAFAVGTGALVEYMNANGEPVIDFIPGMMVYPLEWDMQHITACAFGSLIESGADGTTYYVQRHTLENGTYHIHNSYLSEKGVLVDLPEGLEEDIDTHCTVPTFQIIRPNIVNSYNLYNPMGMSVYGNAVDLLKAVDLVYDAYVNEFSLGRTRMIVPTGAAKLVMQEDGTAKLRFDPNDVVTYAYESKDPNAKPEYIQPQLRADQFELGIQRNLNLLAKKCGLGNERYQFDTDGTKTATEVISEKSELYQSMKKHEILLRSALIGMGRALAQMSNYGDADITVDFDDSIIEDRGTLIQRHIDLVTASLESKLAAIMEIKHCSKADAEKELAQIASEESITGTPDDWFAKDGVADDAGTDEATDTTDR
ncbi:MAG: phage portal protein [Eubacteriales bacterium]|nr:phage portal protein [Eubacteriales bacterium]